MTNVAIADDHTLIREGLRRGLELHGISVVGEAADGAEAVDLAERIRPDVLLMDVSMPRLDGVEAARRIGARVPDVKVVMLTMYDDPEVVAGARSAGVFEYLVKDCGTSDILAAIRRVTGREPTDPVVTDRTPEDTAPAARQVLTRREAEVLQLIAEGCSTTEVAHRLYISFRTVKNHLVSIYEKLECRDRTQAVVRGAQLGIVSLQGTN